MIVNRRNSRMNQLVGRVYCEGDGTGAGAGSGAGTGAGAGAGNPTPSGDGSGTPKLFTQDELNKFLAEDRRKHQEKLDALKKEADKLQGTKAEKEALQQKISEMEKQFLTKEQLAAQEQEKAKREYETQLSTAAAERDQWKNIFVDNLAETAIAKAAAENKAYNPTQLSLLLKNQVKVKQKTDSDGKPTMEFDVILPVSSTDKDGKPVTLELSVAEGVKKMREQKDFANLFLVEGTPGTGATTINNSPVPVTGGPPSDPAAYRAWRATQKANR
jgi:hypothetical protein